jgi:hypothetical protein
MTETIHLALPYIDAAQAQKHVTHNEALELIDALTQLAVIARGQTAPPESPAEGDRYIVGAGAADAFSGKEGKVAAWLAGAWAFLAPKAGWLAYVEAEDRSVVYDGSAWIDAGLALRNLQNLDALGIGTTADGANPLSAKLNGVLLAARTVAEGGTGDMRLTLAKEMEGDTVSLLLQSNWSGRAEIGLSGDDDLRVKVSADGAMWNEAIAIDKTSGRVSMTSGALGAPTSITLTNGAGLPIATGVAGLGAGVANGLTYAANASGGVAIAPVANACLATMAAGTLKGNNTGASAMPADLTGAQATALLSAMTGDAGAGGAKGLAPAPSAGDAGFGKVLGAAGAWVGQKAGFRNRLRNANFAINSRNISGTVTLGAGALGHDGVVAGASGATYTFAMSGLDMALDISAGSLALPIDRAQVEGGTYVLSQAGTAQARIWQTSPTGTFAAVGAGLVVSGLTANTLTAVEFSTGTVLRPQLEPGNVATAFERRPRNVELALCDIVNDARLEPNIVRRNWVTGNSWLSSTSAVDNQWVSLCWSAEAGLFVAVAISGAGDRVMTSPDGINWTTRTSAADNQWRSVCRAREIGLFVAVADSGVGNRVMTSPDGIVWTLRASAADNSWRSVCWARELGLLVAVAVSGSGNRVMTSPDGINWTIRASPADNQWISVVWCRELGLLVAVAQSGSGNRVMTSPDAINWTVRASAADNSWRSVCWARELGLVVAVAISGSGNRVMTSPDGINWTLRTSAADNDWNSVCWAPEIGLLVAASSSGSGNRLMTSSDAIGWTLRASATDNNWNRVAWAGELGLFAAVATSGAGDRAMTSKSAFSYPYR